MNSITRQTFNTPYTTGLCDEYGNEIVVNKDVDCVGKFPNIVDAKRFARLPELYDALLDAVWDKCYHCLARNQLSTDELMEHGCLKDPSGCLAKLNKCKCLQWLELLRKVRAGE